MPTDPKASELIQFKIEEESHIFRLAILGNGNIEAYRSQILSQPIRLIVDIPNVTLKERKDFIPIIHPLIEVIRIESHPAGVRIVFELKTVSVPGCRISQGIRSLIISIET